LSGPPPDFARNFRRADRATRFLSAPLIRWDSRPATERAIKAFGEPCLIAANHRSVMDVAVGIRALAAVGHSARVLSAEWLWDDPRLARLLDSIGAIRLRSGRGAIDTVAEAIECLDAGHHLLITPEGRVVPPEDRPTGVGSGHKIMSKIACGAGVDVVPGALIGTDKVWPRDDPRPIVRPWDRPTITMQFGDPVEMAPGLHRANVEAVMDAISEIILGLEPSSARR